MSTLWFMIVAVMVAAYVILDGFDIGAGAVHLFIAAPTRSASKIIRAIGPVWDGNEVWLLAAGGVLYFVFPQLYASSFSGFYLPLMMVLWLLMLRAIGIEFRTHIERAMSGRASSTPSSPWRAFCWRSSYGAALGNVVRGVPLDAGSLLLPAAVDRLAGWARSPAFWIGTPCYRACWRWWRLASHGAHYVA